MHSGLNHHEACVFGCMPFVEEVPFLDSDVEACCCYIADANGRLVAAIE